MTPETPEPEAPRPGAPRPDGDQSLPPRVLVSVGDLEDPAEWDVILVENQEIDDATARRIAAERAGRNPAPSRPSRGPRAPSGPTVSLPSLDERDVIQAFEADREAEDASGIGDDAFAPPEDPSPVRRRPSTELPPTHDAFDGIPEPGDPEPEPEPEPAPTDDELVFPATDVVEVEEEPVAVEEEPVEEAEPAEPWLPAHREGPALIDDPDDEFYAIQENSEDEDDDVEATSETDSDVEADGDAETETETADEATVADTDDQADDEADADTDAVDDEPAAEAKDDAEDDTASADGDGDDEAQDADGDETAAVSDWDLGPAALDEERELLDDPESSFYELTRPLTTTPPLIGQSTPAAPAARPGLVALPSPTARLSSELWGSSAIADAPSDDDVFEDEVEVDSTFPLGPDDLAVDGAVQPIPLDELDYANVFGPVTGSLAVPDLDAPVATRPARPTYEDDLYVFEDDDDGHWPVPPPRVNPRRRGLVALGLAAGVLVALGVGSQVFSRSSGQQAAPVATTTSTTQARVRSTVVTAAPDLTLPTVAEGTADVPTGGGKTTSTTARRGTTTTVKGNPVTTTTAAPTTTVPATTTTEPPPPPTTTTEPPPATTTTVGP